MLDSAAVLLPSLVSSAPLDSTAPLDDPPSDDELSFAPSLPLLDVPPAPTSSGGSPPHACTSAKHPTHRRPIIEAMQSTMDIDPGFRDAPASVSTGGASSDEEVAPAAARPMATLERFIAAHGLGGRAIVPMRATGVANDIWALGDDLVLRVGRDWDEAWADARTESVAVPAAREVGVKTPALVVFDDSGAVIDAAVTVYERVLGDTMGLVLDARADWSRAMRGIGRDLARLHLGVHHVHDPRGWLDDPGAEDPRSWISQCAALLGDELDVFARWIDRLEPVTRTTPVPRFLHDDVHAFNVMVDPNGDYLALLDWGDAGWGDPALELATFAIDWIDPLLQGYAEAAPELADDTFEGRVLWNQIGHSLRKTARPRPGKSAALGLARLHRLAAFARTAGPRWRAWLP